MPDKTTNSDNNLPSIEQALADLDEVLKPLEDLESDTHIANYYAYLYLLWADFHIYILNPFSSSGDDDSGSGTAKIIPVTNGRKIFDYGFVVSTSVGEDYANYCQGKLYETIKEMVAILAKRGVRRVSFLGNSLAMRVAWMECVEHQIEIANYTPTEEDFRVRERLRALKEKARKLQPGQLLRF